MNPELMYKWLRGDENAMQLCTMLWDISHVWDDLIDKDSPVSDEDINQAFIMAIIGLPRNEFYRQHLTELIPVIHTHIYEWLDSNAMEKADGPNEVAYALRSNIGSIIITCARLVGGDDWARSISLDIRQELYGNESYQQYLGEY